MKNDKTIMEDLLQTEKGVCDLYMHVDRKQHREYTRRVRSGA